MRTRLNKTFWILRKCFAVFIAMAFLFNTVFPSYAQTAMVLPVPGTMVGSSAAFTPVILKAVKVHPENPFQFEFIVDVGSAKLSETEIKTESQKLIRYFLASLTIPENDLWVNLSPFEKDRIVPQSFGVTEMGRDLLGEDYILKQLSASLTKPDTDLGKRYWGEVNKSLVPGPWSLENTNQAPGTNHQEPSLSKVWIVPQKAIVYENGPTAYVSETKLKVMMEEDYEKKSLVPGSSSLVNARQAQGTNHQEPSTDVFRQLILPKIEQDVNEGKNFATVRQIYNSLILANWYKKRLKDSILSQIYVDKKKVAGVDIDDKAEAQKIYDRYLEAFKKGVYNYIKEDYDPATDETIPRKYFSGGLGLTAASSATVIIPGIAPEARDSASSSLRRIDADFTFLKQDRLFQPQIASAATVASSPSDGLSGDHRRLKFNANNIAARHRQALAIMSESGLQLSRYGSTEKLYTRARAIAHRWDDPIQEYGDDQVFLPKFIDEVFSRALRMGPGTKIFFLGAGADPIYAAAKLMAPGVIPLENLKNDWATMDNYEALKNDNDQKLLFIKRLVQRGIVTQQSQNLLIVDTDAGMGTLGTALIFAVTLFNNDMIDMANQQLGLRLNYFNEPGVAGNRLNLYYMNTDFNKSLRNFERALRKAHLFPAIERKLT